MNRFDVRRVALGLVLVAMGAAQAGDEREAHGGRDGRDHDRARQAVQAGEILPLKAILERVATSHPGQVMDVDLERRGGRWLYEIKLLSGDGAISKLLVDARDGSVFKRRAHEADAAASRQPGARP